MMFDNEFWNQVNKRFQAEDFEYPERLRKLLKLIKNHMEGIVKGSAEAAGASDSPFIIAIDGRAASGKSTLAQQLGELLDADVIHMDDFFLPPSLRTKERLSEPGGNVHYERFAEEVPLLYTGKANGTRCALTGRRPSLYLATAAGQPSRVT